MNGHDPGQDIEDEFADDFMLDECDLIIQHLKKQGRNLRVEGKHYLDSRCPLGHHREVLVADVLSREIVLRCGDPRCDRSELLRAYGIASKSAETEARERAIQQRLQEMIIDHLAGQRFAAWLAQQPPQSPQDNPGDQDG